MLVLALDTCDSRGSLALLKGQVVSHVLRHASDEEYSSWLLPAVQQILDGAGLTHRDLAAYAVAVGPGSFTGLRVGLTTVKAWAECFAKPVAAVSRLEAVAQSSETGMFVAPLIDAQRGQVFGSLYVRRDGILAPVLDEAVVAPEQFVQQVAECCGSSAVAWATPDPSILASLPSWPACQGRGDALISIEPVFAPVIGRLGLRDILGGKTVDALTLDAHYVRRSDAEIFWKPPLTVKSFAP